MRFCRDTNDLTYFTHTTRITHTHTHTHQQTATVCGLAAHAAWVNIAKNLRSVISVIGEGGVDFGAMR